MTEEFFLDEMYCKGWLSDCEKAVIQIIHGLGEMTEYYEQFADIAVQNGFSVYMGELRGHGRTTLPENVDDTVGVMADDSLRLLERIKAKHSVPTVLMGHSLGAAIAQLMLQKAGEKYACAVLMGCFVMEDIGVLKKAIADEIEKQGKNAPCMSVFMRIFGKVAERFPEKCTVSWVTSDLERALYYESLPYTNKFYSNSFYKSMIDTCEKLQRADFPESISHKPPLFIACGGEDAMGRYGGYPPVLRKKYTDAGFDVSYKLYDGMRHSILQEKDRARVISDIIGFIDKSCGINGAESINGKEAGINQ